MINNNNSNNEGPRLKLRPSGYTIRASPFSCSAFRAEPNGRSSYISHSIWYTIRFTQQLTSTYSMGDWLHSRLPSSIGSLFADVRLMGKNCSTYYPEIRRVGDIWRRRNSKRTDGHCGWIGIAFDNSLEKGGDYQAIIVDDACFVREPDITCLCYESA